MDITDEDHDMEDVDDDDDEELKDDGTSTPPQISYPIEDYTPPSSSSTHDLKHSFSWDTLLNEPEFCAASVSLFQHVSTCCPGKESVAKSDTSNYFKSEN